MANLLAAQIMMAMWVYWSTVFLVKICDIDGCDGDGGCGGSNLPLIFTLIQCIIMSILQ
jgi:hypothetical protein